MELSEIKATIRTSTGNGPARALRRDGKVPAILYGPKTESKLLTVDRKTLDETLRNKKASQVLLNLVVEDDEKKNYPVMIKELQRHPVSRSILHADFYAVMMDKKIRVRIPVVTTGKSKGVEMGGLLQIIRRELEVLCLPTQIPKQITIDVTDLEIGDSVHVKEIPFEGEVEVPADVNFTVVTVLSSKVDAKEEGEEGEEEAETEAEAAE